MITLSDYDVGDTDYVSKMKSDNVIIAGAINALQAAQSGAASAPLSIANILTAMFGSVTALIGAGSYLPAGSGTNLIVAAGTAYLPSSSNVVSAGSPTTIAFSGFGAATYYVNVSSTGTVTADASATSGTLYSVVWTGGAFGAITRVAPIVAGGAEVNLSQFISGVPGASEIMLSVLFADQALFPAGLVGSQAKAGTASTGTASFAINQNGSSVGSVTFTASAVGVFTFASAVTFAAGDIMDIVAPASPDATLANIRFTILGTRNG